MNEAVVEVTRGAGEPRTAIVLPCGPDQFSQFIASLLGRPQELSGIRSGVFSVTKAEALQVHHMIVQRVGQQHGVAPLQFTATVHYDDGSTVLLNSVDDFENYHEVRALQSIGLEFSWTFLLNFPGQSTPEKQEVEFSFGSRARRVIDADDRLTVIGGGGSLSYRIKHTARTWGSDIESMLIHYMDTVIQPQPRLRAVMHQYSGWIGALTGIAFFLFLLGGFVYVNNRVLEEQSALLLPALGDKTSANLKLDRIIAYLSVSRESLRSIYSTLYVILSVVGSFAVAIWIGNQAESRPPSGVLLTKRSQDQYAESRRAYSHSGWRLCASVIVALAIGVAGNLAYDFAVKGVIQDLIDKTTKAAGSNGAR